ncbi:hypothetical protein HPB49_021731 [Dermacentor silvarum]|uniref:Uncharacterized protein n=1 Tax=Dermacentor silvarum TaxID=543639 RepID=A0ACB8C5L7_DERSI|nr:hypothetical protein HPB49_021731 [Dermacentor silvarum]
MQSPHPATPSTRQRSGVWCGRLTSALLSGSFVVAVLVLLAVLLFPRVRRPRHGIPCWSEQCGAYARALSASINSSRDPCEDFHRYLCDRWRPSSGGRWVLEDSLFAFHRAVMKNAAKATIPLKSQSGYEKAAALYKSCVNEPNSDELARFEASLHEHRLPWPAVDEGADALDVAIDLALNWHFAVFFYVYLVPAPASGEVTRSPASPPRLMFTDSFLGFGPSSLLQERERRAGNAQHICDLSEVLNERKGANNNVSHCRFLDNLQHSILVGLARNNETAVKHDDPSWTRYGNLERFARELTPSVSAKRWIRYLWKYLPGEFNSASVTVDVRSRRHMSQVGRLLDIVPNGDLLDFAGLSVVQGMGRFASSRLAILIYGDESTLAERHPQVCYRFVTELAPTLLTAQDVSLLLDPGRVIKAGEVFEALKRSVVSALRTASWLSEASRTAATSSVHESVLTYEAALTGEAEGGKGPAAETLPNFGDSFLRNLGSIPRTHWNLVHRDLQSSSPSARTLLLERTAAWADLWRQPDAFPATLREVVLPNVYMLGSVYPADAYESVNYGVVGSLLVRQLLAAASNAKRPATVEYLERRRKALKSGGLYDWDNVQRCVQNAFVQQAPNATAFRDDGSYLNAMFVLAASLRPLYEALSASPGYPEWSNGFERYSADQLFFLALCFPACGVREDGLEASQDELIRAAWCNVPLTMYDKFAEAFSCHDGDNMISHVICQLW